METWELGESSPPVVGLIYQLGGFDGKLCVIEKEDAGNNVGRLLDEQKQAVDDEHLKKIQKHESMVGKLQEKLEASEKPAGSLVEVAEKAGVLTEKRCPST